MELRLARTGIRCVAVAALALGAAPLAAQSSAGLAEAALLAAEDARAAAQVSGNVDGVASGLAEELVYSHGNGRTQTKGELLKAMRAGGMRPVSVKFRDRTVRIFGRAGMIRGARDQRSGDRIMSDTYLGVYLKRAGRWQLVAWQTTPTPSN